MEINFAGYLQFTVYLCVVCILGVIWGHLEQERRELFFRINYTEGWFLHTPFASRSQSHANKTFSRRDSSSSNATKLTYSWSPINFPSHKSFSANNKQFQSFKMWIIRDQNRFCSPCDHSFGPLGGWGKYFVVAFPCTHCTPQRRSFTNILFQLAN